MTIGRTDADLVDGEGYTSRLYSACKRLAWASAIAIGPAVLSLAMLSAGSGIAPWLRYLPSVVIVAFCLGAFLWGLLWPRAYDRRRSPGQWILGLVAVLFFFIPTMILSIGSAAALQYVDVDFDYSTPVYQPGGYPAASFLAQEYIPRKATAIRFKGNTGVAWSLGGRAAFSCDISEEDFLAFAKEHMYELRREEDLDGIDLPLYRRLFPPEEFPSLEHYWVYRVSYGNGGGVVLVYDLASARLFGSYKSN